MLHQSDVVINLEDNSMQTLNSIGESWKITLIDTGENSMTGGRIKRAEAIVGDEPFLLTYGDGLIDINIKELINFHQKNNVAYFSVYRKKKLYMIGYGRYLKIYYEIT